jgi:cytoskeleton protein RodZ
VFAIGATLREARHRRNLDISQCEEATRIRARYLQALEEGHLDLIPAPVYVRSFLRTYAEFLGVDAERLLDEYADSQRPAADEHETAHHRIRQIPTRRHRPHMPGGQLAWLAVGGILSVAILVWVGASDGGTTTVPLPPTQPAVGTSSVPDPATPPPAATTPAAPVAPRSGVVLALTGRGETGSYVEVRRASAEGETLWIGTLAPGKSRRFRDDRGLWIRVGWTEGLDARVNGRAAALSGGTADFTITPKGAARVVTAAG